MKYVLSALGILFIGLCVVKLILLVSELMENRKNNQE